MRFLPAAAAALVLVITGCGSSSKEQAKTTPTTAGGTTSTLPPVQGGSAKPKGGPKKGSTSASKPPPAAPNGDIIKAGSFLAFKTPSRKIGCAYTKNPTTLRCDTTFATRFTHRPPRCEGNYGQSFEVSPSGRSSAICAGDTVLSATGARTIPYGHSWTIGPYACTAQTLSLTCTNSAGHGFRLSKTQQLLF
jgi:hypothetical protein